MNELDSLSNWADYGVLGLVIGALFCVIIIGFRIFMNMLEKQHQAYNEMIVENKKQTSEDFKYLHSQHQAERAEWVRESERREQRSIEAVKEMTHAISQLREKL